MKRSFHDAVILRMVNQNGNLEIELEDVEAVNETLESWHESGKLLVEGLICLLEDDRKVDLPTLAFDDGQILELEMNDHSVSILVEWTKYLPRSTDVREYRIEGAAIRWIPTAKTA